MSGNAKKNQQPKASSSLNTNLFVEKDKPQNEFKSAHGSVVGKGRADKETFEKQSMHPDNTSDALKTELNVVAAIVARSSSPRRPEGLLTERALVTINGKASLEHIHRRLSFCDKLSSIIVAVGDEKADIKIIKLAEKLGLSWIAAFPHDILRRLLAVAENQNAKHIARINGNFPLIDPWALDNLIESHLAKEADYSSNSHYQGLVYGLGAEIISSKALKKILTQGPQGDLHSGTRLFLRRPWEYKLNFKADKTSTVEFKTSVDFPGDEKIIEAILAETAEPANENVANFFHSKPFLAAQGNKAQTAEVSLSKVLLFPEKLLALKRNSISKVDLSYPISVELSLTNKCNQNCLWCSDKNLRLRSPDRLSLDTLEKLFSDLSKGGTKGITIEGGGEPSISPNFEAAVNMATECGLAVGLISNGLNLFPEGRDPKIYSKFEWIRISLDAADRSQYLKLKGLDGFDNILSTLGRLSDCTLEKTLGVAYVLTCHNDEPDKLQDLTLSLRSIGVDYLQIRPVVDHPELSSRVSLNFLKKFENSHFSINLAGLYENTVHGNDSLPCLAHSLSTVIGADGEVWLCGRLNCDNSSESMGNLNEKSFNSIWQGQTRASQIAKAASATWCLEHCPQCRMTKYNQLLADIERLKTRNFI